MGDDWFREDTGYNEETRALLAMRELGAIDARERGPRYRLFQPCEEGDHRACAGETVAGGRLVVCTCGCHGQDDGGEG